MDIIPVQYCSYRDELRLKLKKCPIAAKNYFFAVQGEPIGSICKRYPEHFWNTNYSNDLCIKLSELSKDKLQRLTLMVSKRYI